MKNLIYNKLFYNIVKLLKGEKVAARFFLKRYLYVSKLVEYIDTSNNPISDKVFTCWLQDDIPDLVQLCIRSIKKFYPDLILISEKNADEYISIPDYIWEKYRKGIIPPAKFANYIRVALLSKFGGMWIDSTSFLTSPVPKYILKSDLFFFRNFSFKYDDDPNQIIPRAIFSSFSNYFICSKQNNYIMRLMKKFFEEYWLENDFVCNYFFFHIYLMLLKKYNKNVDKAFNVMPLGSVQPTKLMQQVLYDNYDSDLYDWLKSSTFLHKLTYKSHDTKNINPDNFYRYLEKTV